MMFPSIAPMVVMYARIKEGKRRKRQPTQAGTAGNFVGGYLLTWAAAGLLAYAIFEIGRSLDLGFLAWDSGGPYVAVAPFSRPRSTSSPRSRTSACGTAGTR